MAAIEPRCNNGGNEELGAVSGTPRWSAKRS
jgi:hypothetical protein